MSSKTGEYHERTGIDQDRSLSRREFVRRASAAAVLGASLSSSCSERTSPAPRETPASQASGRNVLLIISDDHGLPDSGCYGNPVVRTPRIDELAAGGVRFSDAFATVASCSASRSVIFSGLHTHTSGQFGHQHGPADQDTHDWVRGLPALLNDAGYRTGLIGKFHVQPRENVYPFQELITADVAYEDVKALAGNRDVWSMAQQAERFFSADPDRPFCCVVAYSDPHRDWEKANSIDYPNVEKQQYSQQEVLVPDYLPDLPETRAEMAAYYESVSRLDQGIGFLMDALEKSGRREDTLVIYISDNGLAMPGAKTTLYDPGIHLPMIVSAPGHAPAGLVNNAMVSYVDLLPTILDWTGAAPPEYDLPGRSLLPVLGEENPAGWDEIFASHIFHEITMYYPMRALRTRRYKYILNLAHKLDYPFASDLYYSATWQAVLTNGLDRMGLRNVEDYIHRSREELYDLESDPNEVRNLADDPGYSDVLEGLRQRLRAWQEETEDPWVVKYDYE